MKYAKRTVHCAAEGCAVVIGKGKIFCPGHYYSLPPKMRTALWDGWRGAYETHKLRLPSHEVRDRLNAYQQAFEDAMNHLRSVPATPMTAMATIAFAADGAAVAYDQGRRL